MSAGEHEAYVRGYEAAIADISGADLGKRANLILPDVRSAAERSLACPDWIDQAPERVRATVPARARAHALGTVYLAGAEGRIKIGYTASNLQFRLRSIGLAAGLDMTLFASFPGTRELEAELHEKFDDLRITGEWFRDDERIRRWIRSWQK